MGFKVPIVGMGVTLNELPGELAVYFEIGGCGKGCMECHSPHHREQGTMMSIQALAKYAQEQEAKGATAIVLMGGTTSAYIHKVQLRTVIKILAEVLPVGLYSGAEQDALFWGWGYLTWYKVGPYIKHLGGLESHTTNQRFYRRNEYGEWELRNDLFCKQDTK